MNGWTKTSFSSNMRTATCWLTLVGMAVAHRAPLERLCIEATSTARCWLTFKSRILSEVVSAVEVWLREPYRLNKLKGTVE